MNWLAPPIVVVVMVGCGAGGTRQCYARVEIQDEREYKEIRRLNAAKLPK